MPTTKHYLGVDYHKAYSVLCLKDELGQTVRERKINNTRGEVQNFLSGFQNVNACLEAGRNWTNMYDILEEETAQVKLANPLAVKLIASAKIKTDTIDAKVLADLLRTDFLPTAHVPTIKAREARQILRQRMYFVKLSTMTKNRITHIIDKYPDIKRPTKTSLFGKKSISWLKTVSLKENDRMVLDEDLALLKNIQSRIDQSNKFVETLAKENSEIKYLQSIPGFGQFFATLIYYETDGAGRFKDEKRFHSYCGLIPFVRSSGGKTHTGPITNGGNKWLRYAFIEAVWPAIRQDQSLKDYYEKMKQKKGPNPAKVATARRLATIAYKIMTEKRYYRKSVPSNPIGRLDFSLASR